MQKNKFNIFSYILLGSALFGLFFGAGNIVFPIQIGQTAGGGVLWAAFGFLLTAVGLPLLGILAIGLTGSTGVYDLAAKVGPRYARLLTFLLYLTIGPLFALPRTGSVAFDIAFAPYLPEWLTGLALFVFSMLFFGVAYYFSLRPRKLVDIVGKYLNPVFLIFLGLVIMMSFIVPMGNLFSGAEAEVNNASSCFVGMIDGYGTMDGLAALAFGILIIQALQDMGVKKPKQVMNAVIKSGIIAALLLSLIYASLIYIGGTSRGIMEPAANGGLALAQITSHYFSNLGSIILALIIILACLKTAIGLIIACSEMFETLFPVFTYKKYIIGVTFVAFLLANFGVTSIIEFAKPVLVFIYPLSISLILLALLEPLFKKSRTVYVVTTLFVLYASIVDAIAMLGTVIGNANIHHIGLILQGLLPFSDIGLGWVVPFILGLALGMYLERRQRKQPQKKRVVRRRSSK